MVDRRASGGSYQGLRRGAFAAGAEVAFAAGWEYAVVTGWRSPAMSVVDTLSAQRRPMQDRFGLRTELLVLAAARARGFAELVGATAVPAMARALVLHLLWHRELGVDLTRPLEDRSLVWRAGRADDGHVDS